MTNELLAEVSILREKVEKYEKAIEDIKAEISKQEIEYRKQNDRCGVGLDMALRIIDKHIGERE